MSKKQEKTAASRYRGKTTRGSGSGHVKGDVDLLAGIKLEAKRTDKASISIKKEWLLKIEEEAFQVRKSPAVEIEIQDVQWVLVPAKEFLNYLRYIREE